MFTCSFCSLQYNTEEELTVHTARCTENVAKSSSKLHICRFCDKSFMTSKELDEHACKGNVGIMLSCLKELKKTLEVKIEEAKPKVVEHCHYCLKHLNTVNEVIAHRETCEDLQAGKIIELVYRHYKEMVGHPVDKPVPMTSMSSSSPKPSTSKENKQTESSKKRVLDTAAESILKTFSLPSKICRTSDKDITDIETGQKSATDSKISDAETKTCKKETFECVLCVTHFESEDKLRTHIIQCCKTDEK